MANPWRGQDDKGLFMSQITIASEEQAWELFRKAVDNDLGDLGEFLDLKLDAWPTLTMHISGKDFHGTVPTRLMPPILDLQKNVHRMYCLLRYGSENLRKLTQDERERLELLVKVDDGSSIFGVDISESLNEAIRSAVDRMESRHILIIVLGLGLFATSGIAWKDYLNNTAKVADIESRVSLSTNETERLKIFAQAKAVTPQLASIQERANEFKNDSLHKLRPQDAITIPGTSEIIDGTYASEITHTPRAQSVDIRVDGEFVIQSVDSGGLSGYRFKARRTSDGKIITARIPDGTLTNSQLEVLKNSEWAKTPVIMQLNAKELRGEISSAILVSATTP